MSSTRSSRKDGGFTLIEVAIAVVIIAIGVVALMVGIGSSTRVNSAGRTLSQGVLIAQDLREWSIKLPFFDPELVEPGAIGPETGETDIDDLDDLDGQSFSPPRDGVGNTVTGLDNWTQDITVQWMESSDVTTVSATATDVVLVDTTISHQGQAVFTTSGWSPGGIRNDLTQ